MESELVPKGLITQDVFLAGYGAAQAIPGPLFTFAAYLGAAAQPFANAEWSGILGGPGGIWIAGILGLCAVFLPSFLLIFGVLPFWERLRSIKAMRFAMQGANAAVVGLLFAALIHPVASTALHDMTDIMIVLAALFLLIKRNQPSWLVVLLCAVLSELSAAFM